MTKRIYVSERKNLLLLPILLLFWLLIFIGRLLLLPIKIFFRRRRRPGRPRLTPFHIYYGKKLLCFLDRIFPKPLRIGALLSTIAILAFGYSLFLIVLAHDLPDPHRLKEPNSPVTTEFTDRTGELLYRLYEGRNRTPLTLNDVSPHFINATVSIEDKNFFSHPGIDVFGITRAFISNLQNQNINPRMGE